MTPRCCVYAVYTYSVFCTHADCLLDWKMKSRIGSVAVVVDICSQSAGWESQRRQRECVSRSEDATSSQTVESRRALGRNAGNVRIQLIRYDTIRYEMLF